MSDLQEGFWKAKAREIARVIEHILGMQEILEFDPQHSIPPEHNQMYPCWSPVPSGPCSAASLGLQHKYL